MIIDNINVQNEGYVFCKSGFYSAIDCLSNNPSYTFSAGINKLIGEIDSGNWAISYLLSMYRYRPKDFVLFGQATVSVNNKLISLNDISEFSCYMDSLYPLFNNGKPVRKLVKQGLKNSDLNYSCDDIRNLFCIDSERFERPLTGVGNEIFKAMAAIGFSENKEIFCFPWLSNMRFKNYHQNLTGLLQILEGLKKVVIIPVGKASL